MNLVTIAALYVFSFAIILQAIISTMREEENEKKHRTAEQN